MSLQAVVNEIRENGEATALEIAAEFDWPVKKASTYLLRCAERGWIQEVGRRTGAVGRPAIIWSAK